MKLFAVALLVVVGFSNLALADDPAPKDASSAAAAAAATPPKVVPEQLPIPPDSVAAIRRHNEDLITKSNAQEAKVKEDKKAADDLFNQMVIDVKNASDKVTEYSATLEKSKTPANPQGDPAAREALKKGEADRMKAMAMSEELSKKSAAAAATATEFENAQREAGQSAAALNTRLSDLDGEIAMVKLGQTYDSLVHKFEKVDDNLDRIEAVYDKSVMGAYVEDKMAQMINSISICKAVNRCQIGDPKKIPTDYIRQELFPDGAPARSDAYDHVKERRDKDPKMFPVKTAPAAEAAQ